jgi:phospholipase C
VRRFVSYSLGALAAALGLAACSSSAQPALPLIRSDRVLPALALSGAGKITHIVYIVQENRSFDNLFQGYPGADSVASGKV